MIEKEKPCMVSVWFFVLGIIFAIVWTLYGVTKDWIEVIKLILERYS